MPFFQSMGVRFGVQSILENCGVDKETAGWVAAGASLATAVVTADMHGHLAGEAASHAVSHATSHGASHATSHGANESANHVTEINYEPLENQSQTFNYHSSKDVINPKNGDHLIAHLGGYDCNLSRTDSCPKVIVEHSSGSELEKFMRPDNNEIPVDFIHYEHDNSYYIDHALGSHEHDIHTNPNGTQTVWYHQHHPLDPNTTTDDYTKRVDKYTVTQVGNKNKKFEVRATQLAKILSDRPC